MSNAGNIIELINFLMRSFVLELCSPESTIAGILDLSEDKTVNGRLLSNLKVPPDLQDSVATLTKWTERNRSTKPLESYLTCATSRHAQLVMIYMYYG